MLALLAGFLGNVPAQTNVWSGGGAGKTSSGLPLGLEGVGFDQLLGEQIPLDVLVRDEQGREAALGGFLDGKPAVLTLVYYECPMLCSLELNGLLKAMRVLPLDLGRDYKVLTLSFDPGEGPKLAAAKKEQYLRQYGREGGEEGWRFFTADSGAIERVTAAAGFRYRYDAGRDDFSHASGIVVLTPEGKISRYFYGVDYSPRDLRLGLVEASQRRIGSLVDQVLLFCFHYDPAEGKYTLMIMNVLRLAGLVTVAVIAGFILLMVRRDRRQKHLVAQGG
jgi:protein SCO1/2